VEEAGFLVAMEWRGGAVTVGDNKVIVARRGESGCRIRDKAGLLRPRRLTKNRACSFPYDACTRCFLPSYSSTPGRIANC